MASKITFHRATDADARAYYGGQPKMSMRGYVAKLDGEVVGIGGVYYENGAKIAFSEIRPEYRQDRKALARGCRLLMAQIEALEGPVFALPDPGEPTSAYLLVKLGWKPTGRITPLGELMVRG